MTVLARLPRWTAPVAVGALALAGCVALALVSPQTRAEWVPSCPFRAATGFDCPGCGGTRATYALLHGDLPAAASHNLLLLVLGPLVTAVWLRWLWTTAVGTHRPLTVPAPAAWTIVGLVVTFAVGRNVPLAPLTWLASG